MHCAVATFVVGASNDDMAVLDCHNDWGDDGVGQGSLRAFDSNVLTVDGDVNTSGNCDGLLANT